MNKIIPFPPDKERLRNLKLAEQLLALGTAIKKTSIEESDGAFEFGLFPVGEGFVYGACLTRDADGKEIGGSVRQFQEKDGFDWFKEMQDKTNE